MKKKGLAKVLVLGGVVVLGVLMAAELMIPEGRIKNPLGAKPSFEKQLAIKNPLG